jgi:hypothetical protein
VQLGIDKIDKNQILNSVLISDIAEKNPDLKMKVLQNSSISNETLEKLGNIKLNLDNSTKNFVQIE